MHLFGPVFLSIHAPELEKHGTAEATLVGWVDGFSLPDTGKNIPCYGWRGVREGEDIDPMVGETASHRVEKIMTIAQRADQVIIIRDVTFRGCG